MVTKPLTKAFVFLRFLSLFLIEVDGARPRGELRSCTFLSLLLVVADGEWQLGCCKNIADLRYRTSPLTKRLRTSCV